MGVSGRQKGPNCSESYQDTVVIEDSDFSAADHLAEMMSAVYRTSSSVQIHGLRLINQSMDDESPNVWTCHPIDGGRALDAINLDNFRSVAEVEDYLKHEVPESA